MKKIFLLLAPCVTMYACGAETLVPRLPVTADADGYTLTVTLLVQGGGVNTYTGVDYTFATPITDAQNVRISSSVNFESSAYVGIAEIRFIYAR